MLILRLHFLVPVDGAMFLEFIPAKKQWLLTLLSAWWAVGQVVGSLIVRSLTSAVRVSMKLTDPRPLLASGQVWPFAVKYSCPTQKDINSPDSGRTMCMPGTLNQNRGWRSAPALLHSSFRVLSLTD